MVIFVLEKLILILLKTRFETSVLNFFTIYTNGIKWNHLNALFSRILLDFFTR